MKHIVSAALVGLTAISLIGGSEVRSDSGGMPTDGKWQAIEAELAGKKFPPRITKSINLTLDGDNYLVTTDDGEDRGTVRIRPDEKPSAMDITGTIGPNKGKTFLAIYKLEGDKLIVCYDLAGKSRPKEFKTEPATQLFLAVYQKSK